MSSIVAFALNRMPRVSPLSRRVSHAIYLCSFLPMDTRQVVIHPMHDHDQIVQGLDVLHRGGINKELQEVRSILKEVVGLETMVTRCTGEYVGAIQIKLLHSITQEDIVL